MDIDSIFEFGKYKGRTVREVWTGTNFENDSKVISIYLRELFNFIFIKEKQYSIPLPIYENIYNEYSPDKIEKCDFSASQIIVTKNYIIIENVEKEELRIISFIISTLLLGNYSDLSKHYYLKDEDSNSAEISFSENTDKLLTLMSKPSYIGWCINNVLHFSIKPDDFDELIKLESKKLVTFEVSVLKENLIEYKPIFKTYKSSFSKECIELNRNKYNKTSKFPYSCKTESYDGLHGYVDDEDRYCPACQESPCRCSDPF